jgi:hypothetical protein
MDVDLQRDELSRRLAAARPELPEDARSRIAQRVRPATNASSSISAGVGSRLALILLIMGGILFGSGSAAVAVNALSTDDNAAVAQYGPPECTTTTTTTTTAPDGCGQVLGESHTGSAGGADDGSQPPQPPDSVRSGDQLASGGSGHHGSLPFTGYVTVPLLLIGVGLLVSGLLLSRKRPSPTRL